MPTVALHAHYEGSRVIFDEPHDIPDNANLLVAVVPADPDEEWLRAAAASRAFSFLTDPAEDIYTATDGEPFCDEI